MRESLFYLFTGLVVFAGLGLLLSRRIFEAVISLMALLLGVAALFGLFEVHFALVAQLLLYAGGVMVLFGFVLHLYPDPVERPAFGEVRLGLGRAVLFVPLLLACYMYLPWEALGQWASVQNPEGLPAAGLDPAGVGRNLALPFALEFEWLGVMMLMALVLAGWYLKFNEEHTKG